MEGVRSIPVGQLRSHMPFSTAKKTKKKPKKQKQKPPHQNIQYPTTDTHSYTFG